MNEETARTIVAATVATLDPHAAPGADVSLADLGIDNLLEAHRETGALPDHVVAAIYVGATCLPPPGDIRVVACVDGIAVFTGRVADAPEEGT